jgi:hypothetical protein
MPRWQRGEAEVEQLVRSRELEHVTGAAADGAALLAHARRTVATAAGLVHADAYSAYVLRVIFETPTDARLMTPTWLHYGIAAENYRCRRRAGYGRHG